MVSEAAPTRLYEASDLVVQTNKSYRARTTFGPRVRRWPSGDKGTKHKMLSEPLDVEDEEPCLGYLNPCPLAVSIGIWARTRQTEQSRRTTGCT